MYPMMMQAPPPPPPPSSWRQWLGLVLAALLGALLSKYLPGLPPLPPLPIQQPPEPPAPPKANPQDAIANVYLGRSRCSCAAIGPRRSDGRWNVLCAEHCTSGRGQKGVMVLRDGREIPVTVASVAGAADWCWLVTDQPAELPHLLLASENPPVGTKVFHMGYGVDRPGNREDGEVIGMDTRRNQLQFRLSVSSGDSGGPIIRSDTGEVVSCVCCTYTAGFRQWTQGTATSSLLTGRPASASAEACPMPVCAP
jgi:hypothetical protein